MTFVFFLFSSKVFFLIFLLAMFAHGQAQTKPATAAVAVSI